MSEYISKGKYLSILKHDDNVAILHMHDTENNNTFHEGFIDEMIAKLKIFQGKNDIKAVVFKGLEDIFCAGAAKSELVKLLDGDLAVKDLILSELILEIPVPTIAAMSGGCVGGGLVVGLCCDIMVMAERSMYGGGFADMGFSPGMGYTRLLQWLTGDYIANEMIYTGKLYKGRVFAEKTNVNYVLPKDKVWKKAIQLAEIIAQKPKNTLEVMKYSMNLKKRQILQEARVHEDFMHKITFQQPSVQKMIKERYSEHLKN